MEEGQAVLAPGQAGVGRKTQVRRECWKDKATCPGLS